VTAYVTQVASEYCQSHGQKQLFVRSISTNNMQPMFPGSATITFQCLGDNRIEAHREISEQCTQEYADIDLDPIRHKVELSRAVADAAPPFEVASNESYPTELERRAIAKWAGIRDRCIARERAVPRAGPAATALQATVIEQDAAFYDEVTGKVSALIVSLYQGKLTYGEFIPRCRQCPPAPDGRQCRTECDRSPLMLEQ